MAVSTPLSTRLWLLRHARPEVAPGLCYGRLDMPADEAATEAAAEAFARTLQAEPAASRRLFTSGLVRTRQLGQALVRHGVAPSATVDERLNEMDFGIWEGVPWADIPRDAIEAWSADFAQHAFGGAESTRQVLMRVGQALQSLRQLPAGTQVLWVTHAGVIRAVQYLLASGPQALPQAADWPREAPGFGEWVGVVPG